MTNGKSSDVTRPLDALNFFLADVRDGLGPYLAIYLLTEQKWDEASIGVVMSIAALAGIVAQTPAGALIDRSTAKRALIVAAAVVVTLAGASAYFFGPIVVFWLMAAMALASVLATLAIPADAIDHHVARGLDHDTARVAVHDDEPSGFQVLLTCRPLLIFAAATVLFHFANAAMLPLVGQKLALVNRDLGTTLMSVCIVAAQLVMVPVAMLVGRKADVWGRKPIFATGLAVLTLRGALYPLSEDPYWLVGVQLLDGVGAGIYGALFPLIVADLTRGTGRFNVSQGAIATAAGLGGALSAAVAGFIVVGAGYSAAFLFLAAVSAVGLIGFCALMPETRPSGVTHAAPRAAIAAGPAS